MRGWVHEVGESNQHCRHTHQAVQDGDQLRHFCHLYSLRQNQTNGSANYQSPDKNSHIAGDTGDRRQQELQEGGAGRPQR